VAWCAASLRPAALAPRLLAVGSAASSMLFVYDVAHRAPTRLPRPDGGILALAWSPDGSVLVAASTYDTLAPMQAFHPRHLTRRRRCRAARHLQVGQAAVLEYRRLDLHRVDGAGRALQGQGRVVQRAVAACPGRLTSRTARAQRPAAPRATDPGVPARRPAAAAVAPGQHADLRAARPARRAPGPVCVRTCVRTRALVASC